MVRSANESAEPIRELFIEELEEVTGGGGPDYKKTIEWLREQLLATHACGEEFVPC